WEDVPSGYKSYELMLDGLKGGHSGLDIANGRGNAVKLFARLLLKLSGIDYRIAEINGGSKRNAIPREAEAIIFMNESDESKVKKIAEEFVKEALLEFKANDGGIKVTLTQKATDRKKVFANNFSDKVVNLLHALPHGIMAMSPDIPGLVETSTNLATIFTK